MGRCGLLALLPLFSLLLLTILGHCEMSIYPGLRRKPPQQQQALHGGFDVPSDFLAQLMEENARRRLQQQFEQQLELINMQMARQRQRQERQRYREQLQALAENQAAAAAEAEAAESEAAETMYGSRKGSTNMNLNQYDPYPYESYAGAGGAGPLRGAGAGEFSYKYPSMALGGLADFGGGSGGNDLLRQRIPFAVGPADPRYYEQLRHRDDEQNNREQDVVGEDAADSDDELDSRALDDYEEYLPAVVQTEMPSSAGAGAAGAGANGAAAGGAQVLTPVEGKQSEAAAAAAATTANFHRIKPQTAAAAAAAGVKASTTQQQQQQQQQQLQNLANTRHDINALIDKLQKEGKSNTIVNMHNTDAALAAAAAAAAAAATEDEQHMVMRQHLGMDGETGMYVVALVAGVSAALTVGLIALGVAWLHNRSKAAADVEYPAYGVTGPNKDISPSSGDRKLAQSAQMYHYQHQKQQIIAMENRQAATSGNSCGMISDVESDDDNEEGDYTVYECPGLAPTGEMEVKNPLFLDETPLTPANATTNTATTSTTQSTAQQNVQQQPQQQQQQSVAKNTNAPPTAANKNATSMSSAADEEKTSKTKKSKK